MRGSWGCSRADCSGPPGRRRREGSSRGCDGECPPCDWGLLRRREDRFGGTVSMVSSKEELKSTESEEAACRPERGHRAFVAVNVRADARVCGFAAPVCPPGRRASRFRVSRERPTLTRQGWSNVCSPTERTEGVHTCVRRILFSGWRAKILAFSPQAPLRCKQVSLGGLL